MTVVVLKADRLCAYLDFLLFIDDISGSFQFQGFLTGLFSRRETPSGILWHLHRFGDDRAILKLFYFIFFPTDTFQTCYLKYYFFIALITMQ